MPLALLLQKVTAALTAAAKTLTPWLEIVSLESTVVERARSAFLVHWFGTGLPFEGLSLRARIVNITALDAQFAVAQRSVPKSQGGPNLTSPLLGFAGMLGGILMSPVGAITGASLLLRFSEFSAATLVKAIAWMLAPFALGVGMILAPAGTGVLVGGALAAAGLGFALAAALGGRREIRAAVDLFGALAGLMNAGVVLLDQLLGPRSQVRNPLLRRLLQVADSGAAMFAQLLGAVAVLVRRVAPVLPAVVEMAMGITSLATATFAAIGEVVSGLLRQFDEMRTGRLAIGPLLRRVAAHARHRAGRVVAVVLAQIDILTGAFRALAVALSTRYDRFLGDIADFLRDLFVTHPVGQIIDAFHIQITAAKKAFTAPPPPGTPPPKPGPSAFAPLVAALPPLPTIRDFPDLPKLPDEAGLRLRLGASAVPPLTPDEIINESMVSGPTAPIQLGQAATAAVTDPAKRPSIFAPQWRAAEATFGAPLPKALQVNRQELQDIRDALSVVVRRVLPPALRATLAPRVAEVFGKVDHLVYGEPERPATPHPVRTPQSDEPIRPVVRTLRLRLPGATVGEARRFQDTFTAKLADAAERGR